VVDERIDAEDNREDEGRRVVEERIDAEDDR
jgi:hypothetical protein